MNIVVLEGALSSAPREKELPSGSLLVAWEVTTVVADQKLSVPVVWFDPPKAALRVGAGDVVVVAGTVRRRYWHGSAGRVSTTEVVATHWARSDRHNAVAKIHDRVVADLVPAA